MYLHICTYYIQTTNLYKYNKITFETIYNTFGSQRNEVRICLAHEILASIAYAYNGDSNERAQLISETRDMILGITIIYFLDCLQSENINISGQILHFLSSTLPKTVPLIVIRFTCLV